MMQGKQIIWLGLLMYGGCLIASQPMLYQWVDEQAVPVFSDRPNEGKTATPVILQVPQTYTAPAQPLPRSSLSMTTTTLELTPTAKIIKPQHEATIWQTNGTLDVSVQTSFLWPMGTYYQVLLDKRVVKTSNQAGQFSLMNVDRGTHYLQLHVYSADQQLLYRSPALTIYVHRASALFPNRQSKK